MEKLFLPSLLIASCLMLTACDNHPYKEELQRIYDNNNETGNKAICMVVGG